MSALYLLIGFSLLIALTFLGIFLWSITSGQYTDVHTPALRILFDDPPNDASDPTKEVSH
jgi:cbb3-type cytochrome oxidase maturation protein